MPLSVHSAAFTGMLQTLKALDGILDKAVAQADARKIAHDVLLNARLTPDMFPFTRQVQLACDFAKNGAARVSGGENPKFADEEASFAELKQRIARTLAFVQGVDPAALESGITKDVTIPRGQGQTVTMSAEAYLTRFAVPNFYFHVTTAYAILRENGFDLGKRDFLAGVFD